MKNLILTTSMVLSTLLASSQIFEEEQCVTCQRNTIDPQKYSSAIGSNNISTGERSFAGGINSQATGNYSFAFGENAVATGLSSFAFGNTSRATNNHSFALGNYSEANGLHSVAIGRRSQANGPASFALGYWNIANANSSYLFGEYLESTAGGAFIIGFGAGANRLVNNQPYSMMVGFNSNTPTLFISGSEGINTTGKIGIGNVTDPAAKLHIKADDNEHATLRLEPTGSGMVARIEFGSNENDYFLSVNPSGHMSYSVPAGKNFVFVNGKIVTTAIQISSGAEAGRILEATGTSGNAVWATPAWSKLNNDIYRATGRVGIGIVEPLESLHLVGFVRTSGGYKVGTNTVIDFNRNYSGSNGSFSGNLTVTGSGNSTFTGNVGIGTTNPTEKLEIAGKIKITGGDPSPGKVLTSDASGLASWSTLSADNITAGTLPVVRGGTGLSSVTSGRILFGSGTNPIGTSDNLHWNNNSGRLGIGTTTPQAKLEIAHVSGEDALLIRRGNKNYNFRISGDNLHLRDGESTRLIIMSNGNVGIGVTNPQKELVVAGDIEFSGNLYKNGHVFSGSNWTVAGSNNVYRNVGNVGIGTTNPQAKLQVQLFKAGSHGSSHNDYLAAYAGFGIGWDGSQWRTHGDGANNAAGMIASSIGSGKMYFYTFPRTGASSQTINDSQLNNYRRLTITNNGNVGIGTTSPEALLHVNGSVKINSSLTATQVNVNGTIYAKQIRVRQNVPNSDHVFKQDYNLMPLRDVEQFIREYGHLPEVPSAIEFQENGYLVGDMDDLLLRKVEELTLYIIDLNKRFEALEFENMQLKTKLIDFISQ